jgi:hypothetical protein
MAESKVDKMLEEKAVKKQAAKERKEERESQGITNKLVIEMAPNGLFFVKYSLSGPVPVELRGMFTRKDRILSIASRKNIAVEGHDA